MYKRLVLVLFSLPYTFTSNSIKELITFRWNVHSLQLSCTLCRPSSCSTSLCCHCCGAGLPEDALHCNALLQRSGPQFLCLKETQSLSLEHIQIRVILEGVTFESTTVKSTKVQGCMKRPGHSVELAAAELLLSRDPEAQEWGVTRTQKEREPCGTCIPPSKEHGQPEKLPGGKPGNSMPDLHPPPSYAHWLNSFAARRPC